MPLETTQQSQFPTQPEVFQTPQVAVLEKPKKRFPKKILIGIGIAGLVSIIAVTSVFALSSKKPAEHVIPPTVTLEFWGRSSDEAPMQKIIEEFESKNPYIKVDYKKRIEEDYKDKIKVRSQIGNLTALPNIMEIEETWVDEFPTYLTPITDKTIFSHYSDISSKNNTVNNITFAVPYKFDSIALAYNKKFLQEYLKENNESEIDFNKLDWSSLATRAGKLTKAKIIEDKQRRTSVRVIERAGIGIGSPETITNADKILQLLLLQNNSQIYDPITKTYKLDPKFNSVMEFYTAFNKGSNSAWNNTFENDIKAFSEEKVAMALVRTGDIDRIKTLNPNLDFVTVLPARIGGIQNISLSSSLAIPKNKPNYAQTIIFLEFLSRNENAKRLFEENKKVTFLPAQSEVLNQIDDTSPFAIFSDIHPTAKKFTTPNTDAVSLELQKFLLATYQNNSGQSQLQYTPANLEKSLNDLLKPVKPTVTK